MNFQKLYLLLLFSFILFIGYSQEGSRIQMRDSLSRMNYDDLKSAFNRYRYDTLKSKIIANAYLKKTYLNGGDLDHRVEAFTFLSSISSLKDGERYGDSILDLGHDTHNYQHLITGHFIKTRTLRDQGKRKKAFEELLKVNRIALENKDIHQQQLVKYTMGIMKIDIGEFEGALEMFKSYADYMETQFKQNHKNSRNYSMGLMTLGDAYMRNEKYDSAMAVMQKGMQLCMTQDNTINRYYFTQSGGLTEYYLKNYSAAIDSVEKAKDTLFKIGDINNGTVSYLFLGKTYKELDNYDTAARYFIAVDSMFTNRNVNFPEIREAYEFLIDYYKELNNTEKRLDYVDKLITIDSVLIDNYKYLTKNIIQKYDTAALLSEKDYLTKSLKKEKQKLWLGIAIIFIVLILISIFAYRYYQKQRLYRIKFEALLKEKFSKKN